MVSTLGSDGRRVDIGDGEGVAVTTTVSGGVVTVTVTNWGAQPVNNKVAAVKAAKTYRH
jgi:hypothetical protein